MNRRDLIKLAAGGTAMAAGVEALPETTVASSRLLRGMIFVPKCSPILFVCTTEEEVRSKFLSWLKIFRELNIDTTGSQVWWEVV